MLREDGIATGMAGAATDMQAVASVASGLASGNPDKIGVQIESCVMEQTLAQQLPTFKPYAMIDPKTVSSCAVS